MATSGAPRPGLWALLGRGTDPVMIVVNEEERPHQEGMTVQQLLEELDPRQPLVAVKLNGQSVRRAEWSQRRIEDGDEVIVLPVFAGG